MTTRLASGCIAAALLASAWACRGDSTGPGQGAGATPDSVWTTVDSITGVLIDGSPDRMVYVTDYDLRAFVWRDNHTGAGGGFGHESNIGPGVLGWVTAAGAIGEVAPGVSSFKPHGVYEAGGSQLYSFDGRFAFARGHWAAWIGTISGPNGSLQGLHRDDVLAASLSTTPRGLEIGGYDMAEDGTIAFAGTAGTGARQLYIWRDGPPVQLTFDSTASVLAPVTDGSAVVYARESGTGAGTVQQLIYRGADGGEEELTPPVSGAVFPSYRIWIQLPFYATWNGWTAFEFPDASGTWHTRVRGPGGVVNPVWPGAPAGTRLVSLGPDGQVILVANGTLYLSRAPHATAVSIGNWGTFHHVKWIDGRLYLIRDDKLYRLERP